MAVKLPAWNDLTNEQRCGIVEAARYNLDGTDAGFYAPETAREIYAAIRDLVAVELPPLIAPLHAPVTIHGGLHAAGPRPRDGRPRMTDREEPALDLNADEMAGDAAALRRRSCAPGEVAARIDEAIKASRELAMPQVVLSMADAFAVRALLRREPGLEEIENAIAVALANQDGTVTDAIFESAQAIAALYGGGET